MIPPNHPAQCRYVGHAFTDWGLWVPVQPEFPPVSWQEDVQPILEPVRAKRERFCKRCHWGQVQNFQGEVVHEGFLP